MGIFVLIWILIAVISVLVIYHNKKTRQIEQQERERQQREYTGSSYVRLPKKSTLDPRNPRTYRNASQNQLIIDGIPIYRYGSGENWTIVRKPVTEVDFVDWIRINVKKQHFQTPEERQKYYYDYVQWYYDSNNLSVNVFGGLKFTEGMIELASDLPIAAKERIGEIFCKLLQSDPKAYRFQQELFDGFIDIGPMFFSKIALAASFQVEQDLMADYYHECEFDTEAEVYEYFNNSHYLKKYPRLKEKAIKDTIKWKI